jgi:hypothetical protein
MFQHVTGCGNSYLDEVHKQEDIKRYRDRIRNVSHSVHTTEPALVTLRKSKKDQLEYERLLEIE